ncbi:MAG: type ISP restriction/modification enzyme [Tagaea sp.]
MARKKKTEHNDLHPMHPRRVLAEWRAQKPVPGDMGPEPEHHARVYRRDFWGPDKLELLKRATWRRGRPPSNEGVPAYVEIKPDLANDYAFVYPSGNKAYAGWAKLDEIFAQGFPGVKTSRDDALVGIDREDIARRMRIYLDPNQTDEQVAKIVPSLMTSAKHFDSTKVRRELLARGESVDGHIVRYSYRPFDLRWLYWTDDSKLLDGRRAEYVPHVFDGNVWIEAREKQIKEDFDRGYVTTALGDNFGNGLSTFFGLYRRVQLLGQAAGSEPNIGVAGRRYLAEVDAPFEDAFHHCVAILNSSAYRVENATALRLDWPRVPLPKSRKVLSESAALGRRLAALLDPTRTVNGDALVSNYGIARFVEGARGGDAEPGVAVRANWGYLDARGATMAGRGDARPRDATDAERKALGPALDLLGPGMRDVYLDERAHIAGVPEKVWTYTLGGYLVLKKWLSYRERAVLGRNLRVEEVEAFCDIARRIAAILALGPDLDRAYKAAKD